MMIKFAALCLVWLVFSIALPASALAEVPDTPRFILEFEGGPVWQTVNDVQIPNDASGTRFSLVDVIGKGPWPAFRFYATWNINPKHGLRVLLAPLSVTESTVLTLVRRPSKATCSNVA